MTEEVYCLSKSDQGLIGITVHSVCYAIKKKSVNDALMSFLGTAKES
jgi:hypothetical protein